MNNLKEEVLETVNEIRTRNQGNQGASLSMEDMEVLFIAALMEEEDYGSQENTKR